MAGGRCPDGTAAVSLLLLLLLLSVSLSLSLSLSLSAGSLRGQPRTGGLGGWSGDLCCFLLLLLSSLPPLRPTVVDDFVFPTCTSFVVAEKGFFWQRLVVFVSIPVMVGPAVSRGAVNRVASHDEGEADEELPGPVGLVGEAGDVEHELGDGQAERGDDDHAAGRVALDQEEGDDADARVAAHRQTTRRQPPLAAVLYLHVVVAGPAEDAAEALDGFVGKKKAFPSSS